MRRHEREGFSRGDIQGRINASYHDEQIRRSPPDAKYPGCDARGWPIIWAPCDRFNELNRIAYMIRYARFKYHWVRDDEIKTARRLLAGLPSMDKPRIP